jgi:hypothetical protein
MNILHAQEKDARIERQLNNMNLQFEVTTAGNFKLLFELDSSRTQIVFINSKTRKHEDAEIREISSPARLITNTSEVSNEQLWMLLTENYNSTLGAWQMEPSTEGWALHFTVKVPALMPENRLMMYLIMVAKVADTMEKKFSEDDLL